MWSDMQYNICYSSVSNYPKGSIVTTQSMTRAEKEAVENTSTHMPAEDNDLCNPHSQKAIDDVIAVQDNSAYGSSTAYAAYVNNRAIVSLKQNESYSIIGSVNQIFYLFELFTNNYSVVHISACVLCFLLHCLEILIV